MKRRDQVRPAISHKEPDALAGLGAQGVVAGHRPHRAVEDDIVRVLGDGLFHAEGLVAGLAVPPLGVKLALHHIVFAVDARQPARRLHQNEPVHAVGDVHSHRRGGAVIDIQARIQRLEGEHRGVPRRGERRRRPAAGAGDRVQVDVVRHSAVRAVVQVKLHQVALAHPDELAGHHPAEGPEGVFHPVGQPAAQLAGFQMHNHFRRVVARDGRRDMRGDGQDRLLDSGDRNHGRGVFVRAGRDGRGGQRAHQDELEKLGLHHGLLSLAFAPELSAQGHYGPFCAPRG